MARIRKRDLARVFLRSFFVQAAFNYERMLGLGFCFALLPIARRLFKSPEKFANFMERHLDFFNSHPFFVTYALGAVANLEQQAILKRWDSLRPIGVFKKRVIGPLGAIGDTLFWKYYLPMSALIGVTVAWLFGIAGAFIFLIVFNTAHLYIRIRGLVKGFVKGFDIIRDLSLRGTKKYFQITAQIFSALAGAATVAVLFSLHKTPHQVVEAIIFSASLIFCYFLARQKKLSVDFILIIVVISSIIIGLITIG
ncbi:MAG: PTS system mannose/fructose/sorbose family transporter subunit IID [Calditrichaeota bacterium]|nr:PTS system mannose/fructose/sorbose family transporter subunit IID [Calditrichota bacterium]